MSILLDILAALLLASAGVYCFWHGIKALKTRTVSSPTMMSPGIVKASESPKTYWLHVSFWLFEAAVLFAFVLRWLRAIET